MNRVIEGYRSLGTKPCIYLLRLPVITIAGETSGNLYKFGITNNICNRLKTHLKNLRFDAIILVKSYEYTETVRDIESRIKRLAEVQGERCNVMGNTEIIRTTNLAKYISVIYDYTEIVNDDMSVSDEESIDKNITCAHCGKTFDTLSCLLSHKNCNMLIDLTD